MAIPMMASETEASRRKVEFHLVDVTDGMTPETGEGGGQPQISTDGGAWTNTGISTLTAIGNGRYTATLDASAITSVGSIIRTRYKSVNTAECPGDTIFVVGYNPWGVLSTLYSFTERIQFTGGMNLWADDGSPPLWIRATANTIEGAKIEGRTSGPGLSIIGGTSGHGLVLSRGSISGDDLRLTNSNAPTLGQAVWEYTTRTLTAATNIVDSIAAAVYALLGAGRVTVRSPVSNNNDLELYAGDDYNNSDNRAITFTGTSSNQWPDLTGATLNFYLNDGTSTGTGTVVTPTGTQVFRMEFTAAQTGALPKGRGLDYTIVATLASSSRKVTLVKGKLYVIDSEAS